MYTLDTCFETDVFLMELDTYKYYGVYTLNKIICFQFLKIIFEF